MCMKTVWRQMMVLDAALYLAPGTGARREGL